tara:strand:+ start:341 stop:634 length:294 start_codon:yes stop_codon:yes gene_type:complete
MAESPDNVKDVEPAQANAVENQKAMREQMLKVLLTSEARERLYKIRMVKPDTAKIIEDNIIQLASSGRLKKAITDKEIKEFLTSMQQPQKDFKIRWA